MPISTFDRYHPAIRDRSRESGTLFMISGVVGVECGGQNEHVSLSQFQGIQRHLEKGPSHTIQVPLQPLCTFIDEGCSCLSFESRGWDYRK